MSKKKSLLFILALAGSKGLWACELCKSRQPEVLKEVAHGVGPEGASDYIIMYGAFAIVLIVLVLSIWFLVNPDKTDKNYQIKYQIIDID